MRFFYQAATNTIFSERLDGERLLLVEQTEEEREEGKEREWVANPDCAIPEDVVELSPADVAALVAGQCDGRQMVVSPDGLPALTPKQFYFNPDHGGFFNEDVHGQKLIPVWPSELEMLAGRTPSWETNPDCRIPASAVPISAEQHAALMQAHAGGLAIVAGPDGAPIAVPPVQDEDERRALRKSKRNRLLAASDWTRLDDVMTDRPVLKAAWALYRQQLRDLDMTGTDWPVSPDENAAD